MAIFSRLFLSSGGFRRTTPKPIKIPNEQEKAKAYELGLKWQSLNFTEEANFDTITNKIQ